MYCELKARTGLFCIHTKFCILIVGRRSVCIHRQYSTIKVIYIYEKSKSSPIFTFNLEILDQTRSLNRPLHLIRFV